MVVDEEGLQVEKASDLLLQVEVTPLYLFFRLSRQEAKTSISCCF